VAREFGSPHALRADIALEALVNHVCMALTMDPIDKLALLEIDSLLERSRQVRDKLDQGLRAAPGGREEEGEGERN